MPELTDWQQTAIDNLIALAKRHSLEVDRRDILISYMPETRPGRGHDISIAWTSPDYVVTDFIDVYGRSSPSIGEVDWIHIEDDAGGHDCEKCAASEAERSKQSKERTSDRH